MKNTKTFFFFFSFFSLITLYGQNDLKSGKFNFKADIVSRFIWRGISQSDSPAIQPNIYYRNKNFEIGYWGSYANTIIEPDQLEFYFDLNGLRLTITDALNNFEDPLYEPSYDFSFNEFNFFATTFFNTNNLYFSIIKKVNNANLKLAFGKGDIYTLKGDLSIVEIGLNLTEELIFINDYKINLFCDLIYNPDRRKMFLVLGVSF